MKLAFIPLVLCTLLLFSCASSPQKRPSVTPLPAVRISEIQDLVGTGSFLKAIQEIDWLRRDRPGEVPAADLDPLESKAEDALGAALAKSVQEKKFNDALRYLSSAEVLGKTALTGMWTRSTLLAQRAATESSAGNDVASLLSWLRVVSAPDPAEADLKNALASAAAADNKAAGRFILAKMKERGLALPADAVEASAVTPSFAQMLAGTVTILVDRGIKVENGVGYPDQLIGSGFFIDTRGYILTNYHVIKSEVDPKDKEYSRLYIRLSESPEGERIPAKVIGYDPTFDLALVKTEIKPSFTFGGLGAENVSPGDKVFAIGSPAGLEKTITSGIVSAMDRHLLQMGDTMQVDVPLNPGNSGGPLLNEKGDLIGVGFAGLEQFQGLNFAIPYRWIEKVLPALYNGGEAVHPWLGIALAETTRGLEVVYCVPDEPAAQAGVLSGDILESLDGKPFTKIQDVQEAILGRAQPSLVKATFRRGAKEMSAILSLSARPERPIEVALQRDVRDNVIYPLFGMRLQKLGSFFWSNDYVVTRITLGSVADQSGLSENDPVSIQDWKVDPNKGFAAIRLVIKKRKAGFIESAVQIAAELETDNFI